MIHDQELWEKHAEKWRDPKQITSFYEDAQNIDQRLFEYHVEGRWWEILSDLNVTLLVTREYEHLVMAMSHDRSAPRITFQPIPHPSGIAVNRKKNTIHIASTRNPNQIIDFKPVIGQLLRSDRQHTDLSGHRLVPVQSRFYPGCMYFHDIALIHDELYANAVAHNAIVKFDPVDSYKRVWWPASVDQKFDANYLQLNSIAAGNDLQSSFFSASSEKILSTRPGDKDFPVDKQGVIFSGLTREPIVHGLTRPHSARFYKDQLWVDNSGYGELGYVNHHQFNSVITLSGWTRGLCFKDHFAFIGISRVIPEYQVYAPGVRCDQSQCGVVIIDMNTGLEVGSLLWPHGNQIFAVDWIDRDVTEGFPFELTQVQRYQPGEQERNFYYNFKFKKDEIDE